MKTRRFLGWIAMTAMFLGTGCSSDEVVNDYSPENAIQFGTYVGRGAESRATVITTDGSAVENGPTTTDALTTKGFGVFAYYTGSTAFDEWTGTPNFMYNEKVTGTVAEGNTTWTYSPIKYWPTTKDYKISFFAYAPYDNDLVLTNGSHDDDSTDSNDEDNNSNIILSGNNVEGAPTVTYTVPTTVTEQIDLLYANAKNANEASTNNKVKFNFRHALSRIGFKVEALYDQVNTDATNGYPDADYGTADDGETPNTNNGSTGDGKTTITVKKVVLSGKFYTKGTLNLNPIIKTLGNGEVTSVTDLWKNRSRGSADVNYELKREESGVDNFKKVTSDDGSEVVDYAVVTNTKHQLNSDDSYIMIIPNKDENESEKIKDITVTVVYEVKTEDKKLEGGFSTIENTVTSDKFDFNFKAGKAYDFVLHIGLTSVQFTADVTGWGEPNDVVVNVPLTGSTSTEP